MLKDSFETDPVLSGSSSSDPQTWNYSQFESWLTETTQEEIADLDWARDIYICTSRFGQSIWGSVSVALRIPVDFLDFCVSA